MEGGLECIKKQTEQAGKLHSFMASVLVPSSRLLLAFFL